MLGVTIRFDSYHNADENLVRVLAVSTGGPAQIAGLRPETDYLLGTAEKVFKDPEVLQAELLAHLEQVSFSVLSRFDVVIRQLRYCLSVWIDRLRNTHGRDGV
ncbi:unnamed protein product [Phaeothamnion confervicola]